MIRWNEDIASDTETRRTLIKIGIIPIYKEISLYLIALTAILLFVTNFDFSHFIRADLVYGKKFGGTIIKYFFMIVFYIIGLIASMYFAFTKKTPHFCKYPMIVFAVLTNAGVGIWASCLILNQYTGKAYLLLFPIYNLLSALVSLILLRASVINESCVSDENATPMEVIIGSAAVIIVIVICQYMLKYFWALTYSVCLTYAYLFNKLATRIFCKKNEAVPIRSKLKKAKKKRS